MQVWLKCAGLQEGGELLRVIDSTHTARRALFLLPLPFLFSSLPIAEQKTDKSNFPVKQCRHRAGPGRHKTLALDNSWDVAGVEGGSCGAPFSICASRAEVGHPACCREEHPAAPLHLQTGSQSPASNSPSCQATDCSGQSTSLAAPASDSQGDR